MGMADTTSSYGNRESEYRYEGMAENAYVIRDGTKYKTGPSFIFPVCDECGALLVDQMLHDQFHLSLEKK